MIPFGKRLVVFPGSCQWDLFKDPKKIRKTMKTNPKRYNRKCTATVIITDSKAEMNLFKINQGTGLQRIILNWRAFSEIYQKSNNLSNSVYLDLYCYLLNIPNCLGKPSKATCLQQETMLFKVINQFAIIWEPLCPEIFQERQVC